MIKKLLISLLVLTSAPVFAESASNKNHGFNYKGQAINPNCVNLLQTWSSENANTIIRSIIVDTCQESNLASKGADFSSKEDGTIYYYEDPDDRWSYFGYKVIGKSSEDIFVLQHGRSIGLYRLEHKTVSFDFSVNKLDSVRVLVKLSEADIPFFQSAEIVGNQLMITKKVWDDEAPRARQCTSTEKTITFKLGLYAPKEKDQLEY